MSTEAPSTRQPRQPAKKSRTLKDKDWEPFKSLIVDFHITRDDSLEQVRQHMKAKHGFDATYV
jgi:hypothetical protein